MEGYRVGGAHAANSCITELIQTIWPFKFVSLLVRLVRERERERVAWGSPLRKF